ILTSLEDKDLKRLDIKGSCLEEVKRLASLAIGCGLDGIVAGATEVKTLRKILPPSSLIVTPGIRPKGCVSGDQKRTMTPKEAIKAGADYLVIGRPITQAKDPRKVVEKIVADING
ncbi:MAG: orotidine 5'-phosphate decarboxylase, partial [Candidatus Omnitrophica bacterium]|nr:orotidine 5'-phosphate decarboxylase [Candidatus Omnitrophota bacterium]